MKEPNDLIREKGRRGTLGSFVDYLSQKKRKGRKLKQRRREKENCTRKDTVEKKEGAFGTLKKKSKTEAKRGARSRIRTLLSLHEKGGQILGCREIGGRALRERPGAKGSR